MSRLQKTLLTLIFAQLACLGCGLWIQDRFLVYSQLWQDDGSVALAAVALAGPAARQNAPAPAAVANSTALVASVLAFLWIGGVQAAIALLVLTHLHSRSAQTQMQSTRQLLQRERELLRTRNAVVFGLAKLAEYRDRDTGQHLERIALYSNRLAATLRRDPRYRNQVTASFLKTIGISSALHDIGKVAIEDSILTKPGGLECDERARMQEHTVLAGECIRQIERHLGTSNFLQMAREIALGHHERWDGTGYPHGLAGEQIPLSARLVAIADVYDALTSKRVYKPAFPHEQCVRMIHSESGRHLDPSLVEVFLTIQAEFRDIAARFGDAGDEAPVPESAIICIPRPNAEHRIVRQVLDLDERLRESLTTAS